MKVWIRAHDSVLALNFDKCTAVWSCMEGPIAGRYAANRMNECTDMGIWPDWGVLKEEVKRHFSVEAIPACTGEMLHSAHLLLSSSHNTS